MEKSNVFFTDLRTRPGLNLLDKLENLVRKAGITDLDCKDKFVAVKVNFGEPGNMAYIRPRYVEAVVEVLNGMGGKVFLTDANTLYKGGRSNGVDHIESAMSNGFNPIEVKAPVIIADGVKGTDCVDLPVRGGVHCTSAKIGRAIADADVIVTISHFKGHEQSGFGGALKNIGMGCASAAGKMFLHSDSKPFVYEEDCRGCGVCTQNCDHGAITVSDRKAHIDEALCVGCGQCVASCYFGAARCDQNTKSARLNEKIAEYSKAVVDGKPQFHICIMMDISPECDCWAFNDVPIAPNVGMAASTDPVALDQACADIIIGTPHLDTGNSLADALEGKAGMARKAGCHHDHGEKDIFKIVHPDTDWQAGLEHAERIGLGSRQYNLKRI